MQGVYNTTINNLKTTPK